METLFEYIDEKTNELGRFQTREISALGLRASLTALVAFQLVEVSWLFASQGCDIKHNGEQGLDFKGSKDNSRKVVIRPGPVTSQSLSNHRDSDRLINLAEV